MAGRANARQRREFMEGQRISFELVLERKTGKSVADNLKQE